VFLLSCILLVAVTKNFKLMQAVFALSFVCHVFTLFKVLYLVLYLLFCTYVIIGCNKSCIVVILF